MSSFIENMIIGEEDFNEALESTILPWVKEHVKDGYITAEDGTKLHYNMAIHPEEKSSVVISHGFCEFTSKFYEVMYYFYKMGYSVFIAEYRGYGFSQRLVSEIDKAHIDDYDKYVIDLHSFMNQIVESESKTKEYILYAHSMGGCIGTLYMEKYPDTFKKAVLSSPLMQMNFGNIPEWSVGLLLILAFATGRSKSYAPSNHGFDGKNIFEKSSALSKTRYDYGFNERLREEHYTTYGGTYGWVKASIKAINDLHKNAGKIKTPILLLQAGLDTKVKNEGQNKFCSEADNVELVCFDDSKHEIFNALYKDRVNYYKKIFEWIDK